MNIIRHRHINRTTKSKIIKKKNKSVSLNKKNKLGNKDLSLLITKRYHWTLDTMWNDICKYYDYVW